MSSAQSYSGRLLCQPCLAFQGVINFFPSVLHLAHALDKLRGWSAGADDGLAGSASRSASVPLASLRREWVVALTFAADRSRSPPGVFLIASMNSQRLKPVF